MTGTLTGQEIRLVNCPLGWPTTSDFELAEAEVDSVRDGQVLVRNLVVSVDPYMRNRMNAIRSHVPPYRIGQALEGGAIGRVLQSRSPDIDEGDLVVHDRGWRDYAVVDSAAAGMIHEPDLPWASHLSVLCLPGITAYAGIVEVASVHPGDTVFISSAAGAVGTIAAQIARLRGAGRVVGSTGSEAKVELLLECGFDAGFDYHGRAIDRQLAKLAPDGIDVYFDNVGGVQLEAAFTSMNTFGRIATCGMISAYNATDLIPGPRNMMQTVSRRLTLRGFLATDFLPIRDQIVGELTAWARAGRLTCPETVVEGLARAPEALLSLMRGRYAGKVLVCIAEA